MWAKLHDALIILIDNLLRHIDQLTHHAVTTKMHVGFIEILGVKANVVQLLAATSESFPKHSAAHGLWLEAQTIRQFLAADAEMRSLHRQDL